MPWGRVLQLTACRSTAVTLTLRYWASSFDEQREASTTELVRRSQQVFASVVGDDPRFSMLTEGRAGRSPNFWLGMYGLAAVVNVVLVNARGAFCACDSALYSPSRLTNADKAVYWRGLKASTTLYDQLISRLMTAPSQCSLACFARFVARYTDGRDGCAQSASLIRRRLAESSIG